MKHLVSAALAALMWTGMANAQPVRDDAAAKALGECLVLKSTGQDRLSVMRWMLAGFVSAPALSDIGAVSPATKARLDKDMAVIFTRLIAEDCSNLSKVLFRINDTRAFEIAGEALGRIAVEELLSDKQAEAAMSAFTTYLKKDDFKALVP